MARNGFMNWDILKILKLRRNRIRIGLLSVLSSLLSAVAQAQFTFTTNNGAITITGYTGTNSVVVIPDTTNGYPVTSLDQGAFANCTNLTAITIPNGITNIGGTAFIACFSLTSVTIPSSMTSISDGTFSGCQSLTNITIPNSVTSIGSFAFSDCYSLAGTILPNNVTNLGSGVFAWCAALKNIVIPSSVSSLAGDTKTSGRGVFLDCTGVTNIVVPTSVTNIDSAFKNCSSLVGVSIPNSVTSIGFQAFYGCSSLASVVIPDGVTTIGQDAFADCARLTSITVPDSVTNIDEDAFGGCSSLESIIIPSGVASINYGTFYGCTGLAGVFFKGNSPTNIGSAVFYGVNNAIVYYLPSTTGWTTNFAGRPTAPWLPQVQTTDASFDVQANQFGFNLNWASGQTVVVEACTNLLNPDWQPMQTNTLTTGSAHFSDPQWTNYPGRFYRLRSP